MAVPLKKEKRPPNYPKGKLMYVILFILIISIGSKVYQDIKAHQHQKIHDYLEQREQIFSSSDLEFKQLMNKVYQTKDISYLYPDIQQARIVFENNYNHLQELKPPRNFKDLHNQTLKWFEQTNASVDYLELSASTNSFKNDIFGRYITEHNQLISTLTPTLIESLQKENIKYKIDQNGQIVYWLNSKFLN